jgi:hypothetical protein
VSSTVVLGAKNISVNNEIKIITALKVKYCKAGGVAQAIECLPSKCEVLSSNPVPTEKKKS